MNTTAKNKSVFYVIFILIMIFFTILCFIYPEGPIGNFSMGILTSSVCSLIFMLVTEKENSENLFLPFGVYMKTYILARLFPNREIRVSMAYLFRIVVDDKFLLIKNLKRGVLSPIGGCYKFYESAEAFLSKLNYTYCLEADVDKYPNKYDKDLRLLLPLKNLFTFLRWFDSANGREYDPYREFYEELAETGIPDKEMFSSIRYSKYSSHRILSGYNKVKKYYELHHFDIFTVYLTPSQKEYIKSFINVIQCEDVCLVTRHEIEQLHLNRGYIIGQNSQYIL